MFEQSTSVLCFYSRIGMWGGEPLKLHSSSKLKTSFEWHDSTITKVFPSTLRNALVVVAKHNAMSPNQSTTQKPFFYLASCKNEISRFVGMICMHLQHEHDLWLRKGNTTSTAPPARNSLFRTLLASTNMHPYTYTREHDVPDLSVSAILSPAAWCL